MKSAVQEEARLLTHNAAQIADSQKCCWQAQVTMRRWSDAALQHVYRTRFLTAVDNGKPPMLSEEEFVALFGICESSVKRECAPPHHVAAFEQQYPLESAFLIRLLVRLPEMAKHVDADCIARFVRQPLLVEHLKTFCERVFECWLHEQPLWFVQACNAEANRHRWRCDLLRQVDRLFDIVKVARSGDN